MLQDDSRPQYPIRTAAGRSGLSPHVLRAWERRFGVVEPARPGGGMRLYSEADVRHLRLLRRLTEAGHSIGRIARLPVPELLELVRREDERARAEGHPPSGVADLYLERAVAAIETMDDRRLQATLMRAVVALSAREFVHRLVLPLLRRVGRLWAEGGICPAHEHLVSVQVGRVLGWLSGTIPVPEGAPAAVAATPSGQRHEFGALLAGLVAAEEGWRVTYLGPDLRPRDIAIAMEARGADVLLLSVVLDEGSAAWTEGLDELRDARAGDAVILVGGEGAAPHRVEIERAGGRWLPDLEALRAALREIRPSGSPA
jgi:DNA-binding transcriptional MerR regulator/methylmalonyl-CoA mutase cobalamin-binding subunit